MDTAASPSMADRIARFDWATTPLGPREQWPQSLRTAVDLMLALPQPGYIGWGPTLLSIYNDAAVPIFAHRHPAALGRPHFDVWPELREPYRDALAATLAGQAQLFVDEPMRLDGRGDTPCWFTFSWTPLRDDDGRIAGFFTVGIETTGKVLAEQALQDSEARARSLLATITRAFWEADPQGRIRRDSPSWRALTGQSEQAWLDSQWADALHPDDRERVQREWAEAVATQQPLDSEYRLRDAQGSWRWTHVRAVPLFDPAGAVRKWVGMNVDVDARHRAEAALHASEARLAAAFQALPVGIGVIDRDGRYVLMNPEMERFLPTRRLPSCDPEHAHRWRGWADDGTRLPPGQFPGARALRGECVVPGIEMLYTDDDGRELWVRVSAMPLRSADGEVLGLVNVVQDIDAIKRGTEAQRLNDARRAYLLRLSDALRLLDGAASIPATACRVLGEHLGHARVQVCVRDDDGQLRGADAPDASARCLRLDDFEPQVRDGLLAGRTQVVAHGAAGTTADAVPARTCIAVPRIDNGHLVAMLTVHRAAPQAWTPEDVALTEETAERTWAAIDHARAEAERRCAHERLARQTRFIEGMLGSLPDYAYAFDREHRFVYTNRAMQALFGRDAEGMLGRTFADLDYPPDLAARLDAYIDRILATGETLQDEVFYTSPTGIAAYFDFTWGPVFDADGRVELIVGTSRDTTARRRMEERLAASEARQTFLLRFADAIASLTDARAIQQQAYRLLAEHLGVERVLLGEIVGDDVVVECDYARGLPSLADRIPGAARNAAFMAAFESREPFVVHDLASDPRFSDADRALHAGLGVGAMIGVGLREHGRVVAGLGVHCAAPRAWTPDEVERVREIGERAWSAVVHARAQQALRASERSLAAIFANAAVGLSEVDAEGRFVRVNEELCRLLGRPRDALLATRVADVVHPADRTATVDTIDRARDSGRTASLDTRYLRPDGTAVWAHSSATPFDAADGGPGPLLMVTVDLTERRAADAARQASERLLQQFSAASSDVLWMRDAATLQWEYLSPAYATVYGEPLDVALDRTHVGHWLDRVLDDDRAHAMACIERVRRGEQVTFEYRIRRVDDGAVRWVRDTDFPILDADGRVHRIGGIGQDVTDLKQAQAALADSEHRLRTLMEGIPQLVWRALDDGDWTWSGPQWQALTGQPPAQSLHRGWLDAVHPDDRDAARAAWARARETALLDVDLRLRRASDGAWIWHHARSLPQPHPDGAAVEWFGTCTDVHELKALQEQQQVLVAELQHRTRNLIGVVRSIADRTMAGSASMDDFRARYRDRMAALARVQGLLSQRDAGRRVTFDQLITAELGGLGVLDRDAQLALDGPAGVGLRSASVQTLALALHELATNAVKYGALAGASGRLDVRWHVEAHADGTPRLCVDWRESGVDVPDAMLAPGARRGYGRELIERALPYQLQADTTYALTPDGVRCTIRVPLGPRPAGPAGTG